MNFRKSWILAVIIIIVTVFVFRDVSKGKKKMPKTHKESRKVVFYDIIKNQSLPLIIEASGQLNAKNTLDLYSEVTGVLRPSGKEFRTGTIYRKGEVMIRVDDTEVKANLLSQRSEFMNLITSILPDINIEFPQEFDKWKNYLSSFEIEEGIKTLPATATDKEKYFISGKRIFTQYYAIKNLEARYAKYVLRAPFNGIVTQANINPGGLVRSGQKIGVFSNMDLFELEISVKAKEAGHLRIGNLVEIFSHEHNKLSEGKIVRINEAIDLNTQTVAVFIHTSGKELRAGMYLDVEVQTHPIENSSLISRNILHNNTFVYLVEDSALVEFKIHAVKFNNKTVLVDNLSDGSKLVSRSLSGAYPGMNVIPKQDK